MKKIAIWLCVFILAASPAFAKAEGAEGAVKKITSEVANAVTDELVGKETVKTIETKPAVLPPGLAKKGKVPPGWAKKEAVVVEEKPSLIQRWVGAIFRKAENTGKDTGTEKSSS